MNSRPDLLTLSVITDGMEAAAVWKKIYGIWSCISTTPNLQWMIGMNTDQAKLNLLKMGAEYEWHRHCIPQQTDSTKHDLTGNGNPETVPLARPSGIETHEGRNGDVNQNAPAPDQGTHCSDPEVINDTSSNARRSVSPDNAEVLSTATAADKSV